MKPIRRRGATLLLAALLGCTSTPDDPAPDEEATPDASLPPADSGVEPDATAPSEDASVPSTSSEVAALCMALATESDCAAATVACQTYGLSAALPYPMIECGTSLADGQLTEAALQCMVDASAAEQAFILVELDRWGLEGEFNETAWLGVWIDGRYQRFAIRAGGGGLVAHEVTRQPCTAITADAYGAPRCEGDPGDNDRVCTDAEYHWACLPYFSDACSGDAGV